MTNYGYLLEYCPGHPYPHDRFDEAYFEFIDGWKVLKPEYDVHHINEDKKDNREP